MASFRWLFCMWICEFFFLNILCHRKSMKRHKKDGFSRKNRYILIIFEMMAVDAKCPFLLILFFLLNYLIFFVIWAPTVIVSGLFLFLSRLLLVLSVFFFFAFLFYFSSLYQYGRNKNAHTKINERARTKRDNIDKYLLYSIEQKIPDFCVEKNKKNMPYPNTCALVPQTTNDNEKILTDIYIYYISSFFFSS